MLSGVGERWKTTIGIISKKETLHVQHPFFVHFFAVVLHDYNVKLPETSLLLVFWRKGRTSVSFTFFSLLLIFTLHWWPLAFLILSPLLQSFHVVLPTKKKYLLCFFFSLSFAGLPPTFSFSLSFSSIFQICGHDNWSIKLNTLDATDTETISTFRFRRYWLLSCLCFTRRRWLCGFLPK